MLKPAKAVIADIQVGETPDQLYYIGTDNSIWVIYNDNGNWKATAIHYLMNYAARDLKITSGPNSQRRLSFVGTDNQIRSYNYDNCEILNPANNGTTLLAKPTNHFQKPKADYIHQSHSRHLAQSGKSPTTF